MTIEMAISNALMMATGLRPTGLVTGAVAGAVRDALLKAGCPHACVAPCQYTHRVESA